jgi:hypothetical protein
MAASSRDTVRVQKARSASRRDASSRPLGLPRRAKGLNKELRHVAPTPHPEPRDGHEGHRLNDLAAQTGRTRHRDRGRIWPWRSPDGAASFRPTVTPGQSVAARVHNRRLGLRHPAYRTRKSMDAPPQSAFKKATRSAVCWAVKPMPKRWL